jgi:ATP-dependent exoDNAse (exonuclease V) beta subunit
MSAAGKNFVIYKSSAGSGKTFTLVKEFLKIALSDTQNPPQRYKRILAITFTNKAAAEMKERVLRALKELSEGKNENLQEILCAELSIDQTALKKRSLTLLFDILHNYGNFSISTIDSFTHTIIRNFSHDLDLPVNFDIETDESEIISKCIDQLISRIGIDEDITKLVLEFSRSKTDEQKSWQVDEEIKSFAEKILRNSDVEKTSVLRSLSISDFTEIRRQLIVRNKSLEKELKEIGDTFFELLRQNNLQVTDFYYSDKGICGYFKKLSELRFTEDNLVGSYVRASINEDKWYTAKKGNGAAETTIDSIKGTIRGLFEKAQELIEKNISDYIIRRSILKDLYSLSLINEIDKLVQAFKEEENILFISEFNQRIAQIISTEPVPFIYEKIGERYKHFLLDEFQDTSSTQWQNLLPLLDNSLSEGNFNLIVGDGKQSIYRWRGGEAEQFDSLPELPLVRNTENKDFWEASLARNADVRQLEYNYRSLKNVIEFNNAFFSWISEKELHERWKKIYHSVNQKTTDKKQGGYVTLDFIAKDEDPERSLEQMLVYINENLQYGHQLRDIVVVVRKNFEGNLVADFLTSKNIPVISSDSLLLKNSTEIRFLLDMLQFLSQPDNAVSTTSILNFLVDKNILIGKSKSEYFVELNAGFVSTNLRRILREAGIEFNPADFVSLPLLECVIKLIETFGLKESKNYIQFFLDELISFTAFNTNSIAAFLEWWDKRSASASLKMPEGSNAVRIITIHKSKGLEFPVVILPFCNWAYDRSDYIWIEPGEDIGVALVKPTSEMSRTVFADVYDEEKQKQVLDNVNLLYVAFTRAADHLHIISKAPRATALNTYSFLRDFAKEKHGLPETAMHLQIGSPAQGTEHEKEINRFSYDVELKNWSRVISIKSGYEEKGRKADHENREIGVLMHYIFSRINTPVDVEKAIQQCIVEGLINAEEAAEMKTEIREIIHSEAIQPFFEEGLKVLNETEILSQHGNVLRPDRLIFKDDATLIIDFKTGKHSDTYIGQLDSYATALAEMGYTNCKKFLVYLYDRSVIEC